MTNRDMIVFFFVSDLMTSEKNKKNVAKYFIIL